MKNILIVIALLIGLSTQAQNYLLKEYYKIRPEGDTSWSYKYTYNEDLTIDTVSTYLYNDLRGVEYYENDTLFLSKHSNGMNELRYDYYNDSITATHINNGIEYYFDTYHLDEQDRVVWKEFNEEVPYVSDIFNVWDGDNIHEHSFVIYEDTTKFTATYHDYLNPRYNSKKYFRHGFAACYNLLKSIIDSDGEENATYEVVESMGDYPVKVNNYESGELSSSYHYVYVIVTDVQEIHSEPATVLSVDYYDIMGRKIEKPERGFYIERKTTNKGIICTKHFIQ